jgi:cation diffusion facilitator family transporter
MDPGGIVTEGNTRAIIAALLANLGIAVAKFVAWLATGAASMLAEAVHSVADSANQALLLWGGRAAQRPATPEHPFGYGRERYFWAFVVSVVLFLLGGVFAISEGVSKLSDPHELSSPGWAIGVLAMGMLLEGFSFRTAIVEAQAVRGNAGWWSFIRRAKSPELPVVLLEDAGALIGLALALVGVMLAAVTGNPVWDAAGSIAIGTLLCVISVVLSIEMKSLLIGESASKRHIETLTATLTGHPDVLRLIHLRTVHLGPDEILVAAKVELRADLDFAGVAATIDVVENALRERVPSIAYLYIEPDIHRGGDAGA